jgi:hypothetical protein
MTIEEIKKIESIKEQKAMLVKYGYFGSISQEERAAALRGERIDHHLTELEASWCFGFPDYEPEKFNKYFTPKTYAHLYGYRGDEELEKYYESFIKSRDPFPVGSDYFES